MRQASERSVRLAFLRGFRNEFPGKRHPQHERLVVSLYMKRALAVTSTRPTIARAHAEGEAMGRELSLCLAEVALQRLLRAAQRSA